MLSLKISYSSSCTYFFTSLVRHGNSFSFMGNPPLPMHFTKTVTYVFVQFIPHTMMQFFGCVSGSSFRIFEPGIIAINSSAL